MLSRRASPVSLQDLNPAPLSPGTLPPSQKRRSLHRQMAVHLMWKTHTPAPSSQAMPVRRGRSRPTRGTRCSLLEQRSWYVSCLTAHCEREGVLRSAADCLFLRFVILVFSGVLAALKRLIIHDRRRRCRCRCCRYGASQFRQHSRRLVDFISLICMQYFQPSTLSRLPPLSQLRPQPPFLVRTKHPLLPLPLLLHPHSPLSRLILPPTPHQPRPLSCIPRIGDTHVHGCFIRCA